MPRDRRPADRRERTGQSPFGIAGDALAQQLERNDRDRLAQRQAIEVRQRGVVLDGDEPCLGCGDAAAGAAFRGDRDREETAWVLE